MDRLEAMSLLLDTLDAGSFSAAARRRNVPVATLTRKVNQLEQQLGAVLLLRSTRRLTLTDAGERYVAGARTIIEQLHDLEREAAGEYEEPTGRLVVSAPRMFGRLHVLPIVEDFLGRHPGIVVDLRLADDNVDLSAGAADVAVRIGALPDSGLIATRVGSMRRVTVAGPDLLARHRMPSAPADLADLPAILVDMPLGSGPFRGSTGESSSGRVRLSVSTAEAAVDAASASIGYARLLHYQVAAAVANGTLRLVLEEFEPEPAPVHVVHAPLALLPVKIRRFLDLATDDLRRSLGAASVS